MKTIHLFLLILISLSLTSCKLLKDDDPNPGPIINPLTPEERHSAFIFKELYKPYPAIAMAVKDGTKSETLINSTARFSQLVLNKLTQSKALGLNQMNAKLLNSQDDDAMTLRLARAIKRTCLIQYPASVPENYDELINPIVGISDSATFEIFVGTKPECVVAFQNNQTVTNPAEGVLEIDTQAQFTIKNENMFDYLDIGHFNLEKLVVIQQESDLMQTKFNLRGETTQLKLISNAFGEIDATMLYRLDASINNATDEMTYANLEFEIEFENNIDVDSIINYTILIEGNNAAEVHVYINGTEIL